MVTFSTVEVEGKESPREIAAFFGGGHIPWESLKVVINFFTVSASIQLEMALKAFQLIIMFNRHSLRLRLGCTAMIPYNVEKTQ